MDGSDEGFRFCVMTSGSMAPAVEKGDHLMVETRPRRPRVGDLVLVAGKGVPNFVHRVIAAEGAAVRTKGDRLLAADHPVPPEEVLGRAVMIVRPDGRCVQLDRSWARLTGRAAGAAFAALAWLHRRLGSRPWLAAANAACARGARGALDLASRPGEART